MTLLEYSLEVGIEGPGLRDRGWSYTEGPRPCLITRLSCWPGFSFQLSHLGVWLTIKMAATEQDEPATVNRNRSMLNRALDLRRWDYQFSRSIWISSITYRLVYLTSKSYFFNLPWYSFRLDFLTRHRCYSFFFSICHWALFWPFWGFASVCRLCCIF